MTEFLAALTALPATWQSWVAVAATAVAGLMRGYSGFGTAILLSPVFSTLLGPLGGVPVILVMALLVSTPLLMMAGVPLGARLFHILPIVWFRRCAQLLLALAGGFALLF